jgi:hypothetical protein
LNLPDNNPIGFTGLSNSIFFEPHSSDRERQLYFHQCEYRFWRRSRYKQQLDVAMTESTAGLANGTLALFNGASNAGTFQIREINVGGKFPSGTFTIRSPVAAAVPEASTWAMMMILVFVSAAFRNL